MTKQQVLEIIKQHDELLSEAVKLAKKFCIKKDIPFDNVSIRCIRPDETLFDVLHIGSYQGPILSFPTSWFWENNK